MLVMTTMLHILCRYTKAGSPTKMPVALVDLLAAHQLKEDTGLPPARAVNPIPGWEIGAFAVEP